ncbi:MFS general substrate transporter [Hanseniaspora valbyensis NRRL Y-1626]|uniref:MFS general substrate transporter n=1 Tax=Hanseniaspora valbyensis NRRL Y-1626 TaxID=766949 RepID=A0A1B7TDM4_9ASCO|nr:MFS general substrate transporter [Hanseniaspora valbyensis NRRL Y-1626]
MPDHLSSSGSDIQSTTEHEMKPIISITQEQIGDKTAQIATILSPGGEEIVLSGDVDDAMKYADEIRDFEYTEEEDKKLVRKLDLCLLPIMGLSYSLQFLDKTSIGSAAILGLRTDLKMVGKDYSTASSMFYYAYMGGLLLFPRLLQKTKHFMLLLCGVTCVWGMVQSLQAAPHLNYKGFLALRFFLGFFESSITPAFNHLTSQYYKQDEMFSRSITWFAWNGFGSILGASICIGIVKHVENGGTYTLASWKLLFCVTGVMSIFVTCCMAAHIPSNPMQCWFLSDRERKMVLKRIQGNQKGFGNHTWKWSQFKEAFMDWKVLLIVGFAVADNIPNGGLTNFSSILISEEFEFTTLKTLKMNLIGGGVEFVCPVFAYASLYIAKKRGGWMGHKMVCAIFVQLLTLMCICLLAYAPNKYAKLAGVYLSSISPVSFVCALSAISSNIAGSTKVATVNALFLLGYCGGNIAGAYTFKTADAPDYKPAKQDMVISYCVCVGILVALYIGYQWENKKKAKWVEEHPDEGENIENLAFYDLTDKENPHFRYSL